MNDWKAQFKSILAPYIVDLIVEKRACGYKYESQLYPLRQLDRFFVEKGLASIELPKSVIDCWNRRKPSEKSTTHHVRISIARILASHLIRKNIPAYIPPKYSIPKTVDSFVPYIFSHDEITALIKSIDKIQKMKVQGWYMRFFPVVFRLLYSSGIRSNEMASLRWKNVDIAHGTITVRDDKIGKDRLVPLVPRMVKHLENHAKQQVHCSPNQHVFPRRNGMKCAKGGYYRCFRKVLKDIEIQHKGHGQGPRLHDLRHTFAVHNLERWLKTKEDLGAKLSILADYLGHESLAGTQKYLRLIPSILPEIVSRMEASVGKLIKETENETN